MPWTDHALLFSPVHRDLIAPSPIGLIDCGARGDIPEPWASYARQHPGAVKVLGFEAEAAEAARLNAQHAGQRHYMAAAAWNTVGTHALYVTDPPQASSLFPPNENLSELFTRTGTQMKSLPAGRTVQRVVDVPTTTIDAALVTHPMDADVLKIDTQGAEYEILEGARDTLTNALFAVIAETWTVEAYTGIKPAWDVMRLMADNGYAVMRQETAGLARWHFPDASTLAFVQHEQMISLELLFFRDARIFVRQAAHAAKAYTAVGIADAMGFPDYGVAVLREILMRWPGEMENVKRCYGEIAKRRANGGDHLSALYPPLRM
ncbi:MAG: FkbM family methyltransferase [Rhodospirillaceae bacterium]|nr:FkbM family methyltransferase [Rhodospirillaceae bacterium]